MRISLYVLATSFKNNPGKEVLTVSASLCGWANRPREARKLAQDHTARNSRVLLLSPCPLAVETGLLGELTSQAPAFSL